MSSVTNNQYVDQAPKAGASEASSGAKSQPSASKAELFSLIYFLLLEAMNVRQASVMVQSKNLSINGSIQNKKNQSAESHGFKSIPNGAKTNTIDSIEDYNQAIAAIRSNIQNELITLRQNSQVLMTQTNTNVNQLEQDGTMNSGWLKTLQSLFQEIDQMGGSQ